jgi:uncharacterized protein (DUF1800 family)
MNLKPFLLVMAACGLAFVSWSQQQSVVTFGQGNTQNVTVTASSNSGTGIRTLTGVGYLPNQNAASRFLSQATLGHNLADIQQVATVGIEKWLDDQMNMPNSFGVRSYLRSVHRYMIDSLKAKFPANTYDSSNVFVGNVHFDLSWFQGAMTAPDLLRWRVAWALSEIFVASRISAFDDNPYALASYYDVLLNHSFSNYRTLLNEVTYHPAMGTYLTYLNNHATDTTTTKKIFPDENYAREVMQLFSIGLYEINPDGTEKRDANNKLIPTYNNNDIAGLAKVFTGLSWGDSRYLGDRDKNKWSYTLRMKFFPIDSSDAKIRWWVSNPRIVDGHEPGPKTFLGQTIAARPVLQGEQDIQDGLNVLFNHPNVGPFIVRRLIQRLVMSNPSPAYIQRTAAVFANNGSGVRGDMKAVIRAILLDPEARDCCNEKADTTSGALREPMLRYMNMMKALPLTTQNGVYRNVMVDLYTKIGQRALNSPSVFNYFQPDYQPNGPVKNAGKFAPEFQILNAQTLAAYINGLNRWLINDDPVEFWGLFTNEQYKADQDPRFNFTADYPLARNNRLTELLDKYNLLFAGGKLTEPTVQIIKNAISQMPYSEDSNGVPNADDANRRVRIALVLILSSPDYLINR